MLSRKVVDEIEPLTSQNCVNAFIVDDSLFERTSCKKTELGLRVFDHTSMRYTKGFRLMILGWTDENMVPPVNSALLASSKASNLIGPLEHHDGRSLAAHRRTLTQKKGTDVMIEQLRKPDILQNTSCSTAGFPDQAACCRQGTEIGFYCNDEQKKFTYPLRIQWGAAFHP